MRQVSAKGLMSHLMQLPPHADPLAQKSRAPTAAGVPEQVEAQPRSDEKQSGVWYSNFVLHGGLPPCQFNLFSFL